MSNTRGQIYTEKKTAVGVWLGGPIAGAYYFWRTFTSLGMSTAAAGAPIVAALLLVIIFGSAFVTTLDRIPNVVFWAVQMGLTFGLYRAYLARPVEEHLNEGNSEFGWGNTIAIALSSLVLTLGILFAILYFNGAFSGASVKYFGTLRHEVAYDEKNVTPGEVDEIGAALTGAGFFDQELPKTVDVAKDGDRLILNMYCSETARDPEFIQLVRGLREDVQRSFPTNPIVIDLVIGTPENRIARVE